MIDPPDFKVPAIRESFVDAMTDENLTQDEIKRIVRHTLSRDAKGQVLNSQEVQDLLLLSRHKPKGAVTSEWLRRYVLGLLLTHVKAKPPPKTRAKSFEIATRDGGGDYRVKVQILDDAIDRTVASRSADTAIQYSFSSWNFSFHRSSKRIQSVSTWPRIESPITIQTKYGVQARKDSISVYGRGTTNLDILEGNISLAFHESCHRADQEEYLKNHPLPRFSGRVRMRQTDFERAVEQYQEAVNAYFAALKQDTIRRTDEVGFKLSEHQKYPESVLVLFRKNYPR